jgi:outer membrane protein assembly factor BamB
MTRLSVVLTFAVVTALNAAAPPLDPLPDLILALARDVSDPAALRALADYAASDADSAAPDDPGLRVGTVVRAARLLRGNLDVQPGVRAAVVKELRALAEVRPAAFPLLAVAASTDELLAFVAGSPSPAGEVLLHRLMLSPDRRTRGRAVLALARLRLQAGLMAEAAALFRRVGAEFGKDRLEGKLTGADELADVQTDKRLLPFFETPPKIVLPRMYSRGERPMESESWQATLDRVGDAEPSLRARRLLIDTKRQTLLIQPRDGVEPTRRLPLGPSLFGNIAEVPGLVRGSALLYQPLGSLVFLSLGDRVLAADAVRGRLLWERRLLDGNITKVAAVTERPDGTAAVRYERGEVQLLGTALPLTAERLVIPAADRLLAVDPLTGMTHWSRPGEKSGSLLIHDGARVHVIRQDEGGRALSTVTYRMEDGRKAAVKDFAALFNRTIGRVGTGLLIADGDAKALTLRLVDPTAGRDVWSSSFPAGSRPVESTTPAVTGVVEPDGTFHLIEAATGRRAWKVDLFRGRDRPLGLFRAFWLMADADKAYVMPQKVVRAEDGVDEGWKALVQRGSGLRAVPVHGAIVAFDRATGRPRWEAEAEGQMLLVGAEAESWPVLVLASQQVRFSLDPGAKRRRYERLASQIMAINKGNGKLVYDAGVWAPPPASRITRIEATPDGRRVRLWCERALVELVGREP